MTESETSASPNSIRYFYHDPLAAAWMSKHFGMKLLALDIDDHEVDAGSRFIDCDDTFRELWQHDFSYLGKLYVHPDSLHLLEPQVGDLYELVELRPLRKATKDDPGEEPYNSHVSSHLLRRINCVWCEGILLHITTHWPERWKNLQLEIIQRNGLAFHWPEREAA